MDIIYFLIPLGLILLAAAIGCLVWAVRSGQYDDLDGPAHRILFDEPKTTAAPSTPASDEEETTKSSTNVIKE